MLDIKTQTGQAIHIVLSDGTNSCLLENVHRAAGLPMCDYEVFDSVEAARQAAAQYNQIDLMEFKKLVDNV